MTAYLSLEIDILCLAVALSVLIAQGRGAARASDGKAFRWLLIADAVALIADGAGRALGVKSLDLWLYTSLGLTIAAIALVPWYLSARQGERSARVIKMICLMLPVAAAGGMQRCLPDFPLTAPVLTLTLLVEFLLTQFSDIRARKLASQKMESELNNSAVAIMLSQIQPHFLYNALNAIEYLCVKDPLTAHQAIERFAKYLRSNMDSLKQNHLIPFSKELEHLKNYLYLEELRFGDRLRIAYDIKTDEIWLPPLTIQPLVENAIRYGIMQRPEGGTVTVATRREGDSVVLTISDNGVGFDPMAVQYDGRSHIGISNTRERLHAMCGGIMEIESLPGKGTSILIRVPWTREKEKLCG